MRSPVCLSHPTSGPAGPASLDFRDAEDWWKYLNQMALRCETPVKVTVGATH
jgi:hypothetical protein